MLDKYKDSQNVVYSLLKNAINNDKLSHAYLFDVNNNPYAMDIILSFVKEIFCLNKNSEEQDIICKRIDDGNFLELKIINPDGLVIKKEQLSDLQEEYSMSSIESDRRIYIINNCERMNLQAANSILKFLEEPSPNIIAILLTNNIYNCLDTIISRCQVLSLINEEKLNKNIFKKIYEKTDKKEDFDIFVEQEIKNIIDFYKRLEQDKTKLIAFYDITNLTDKIDILFDIGIKLYIDILNYKLKRNLEYFESHIDDIKNVSDFNEIGDIIRKIEIINDFQSKSSYNVNRELFVNNFIITFSGGNLW